MAEVIESRYAKGFEGLSVSFSREKTPLLTGGAIKKAIDKLDSELIVVLNGDSFVQLKLKEITKFHQKKGLILLFCQFSCKMRQGMDFLNCPLILD